MYARKISEKDDASSYNVDHTSLIFLMSDENKYLDIVNTAVSEKEVARSIIGKVMENERRK